MKMDEVNLFSLEMVVDKIYLPHTACIFPSAAFRLLDFPMVIIKHVEKDLEEQLMKKLTKYPNQLIPEQLRELQDESGTFVLKKGKSCLFKISLSSLRKQLNMAPLYLIILDSFYKVPKLVANTIVSLKALIEKIHDDFVKNGKSIPSVHGDKGLYKLFNLMGEEIGYIVLGYRLLSLGPAIMKHISEKIFPHSKPNIHGKLENIIDVQNDPKIRKLDTTVCSFHSINPVPIVFKQVETVSTNTIDDPLVDETDIARVELSNVYTQTERRKKQEVSQVKKGCETNEDVTPDGDHPPPLFYKNTGIKTMWMHRDESDDILCVLDSDDGECDSSETCGKRPQESISFPLECGRKDTKNDTECIKERKNQEGSQKENLNELFQSTNNSNLFPMLSALINEFAALKDNCSPNVLTHLSEIRGVKHLESGIISRKVQTPEKLCYKCSHGDKIAKQPSTESGNSLSRCHKGHKECLVRGGGVPKNKSWIRSAPELSVKKSKLVFGMTNTQRLRLEKGNPKWLKEVDKDVRSLPQKSDDEPESMKSDISTEIQYYQSSESLKHAEYRPQKSCKEKIIHKEARRGTVRQTGSSPAARNMNDKNKSRKVVIGDSRDEKYLQNFGTTLEQVVRALERIDSVDSMSNNDAEVVDADGLSNDDKTTTLNGTIEIHVPQMDALSHVESEEAIKHRPIENKPIDAPKLRHLETHDSLHEMRGFSLQPCSESMAAQELSIMNNTEDLAMYQSTEETELRDLVSDINDDELSMDCDIKKTTGAHPDHRAESTSGKSKSSDFDKTSVVTALRISVPNPMLSENSPVPSTRRSLAKADWSTTTKRDSISSQSYKAPTPRPRLAKLRESINTESLSTYAPSDANIESVASGDSYSEDFHDAEDMDDDEENRNVATSDSSISDIDIDEMLANHKFIPSTKLGYTII